MAYLDEKTTSWFSRHLVILECVYKVRHQSKLPEEARAYYTGFLLLEKDCLLWVTAGHCLDEIQNDLIGRPEYYEDIKFRLVDFVHDNPISEHPVPFDLIAVRNVPFLFHTDSNGTELGWDWGCLLLDSNYARNVLANNVNPIGAGNWKSIPDEFDCYYVLGLPAQNVTRDQDGSWFVAPTMFSLTKVEDQPVEYSHQTDPMFYGTIDPDSGVESIKGMSGGPILGFKKMPNGELRYWIIAVQSRCIHSKMLICATPLRVFREFVVKAIEESASNRVD